jgi:hypothetical protein
MASDPDTMISTIHQTGASLDEIFRISTAGNYEALAFKLSVSQMSAARIRMEARNTNDEPAGNHSVRRLAPSNAGRVGRRLLR